MARGEGYVIWELSEISSLFYGKSKTSEKPKICLKNEEVVQFHFEEIILHMCSQRYTERCAQECSLHRTVQTTGNQIPQADTLEHHVAEKKNSVELKVLNRQLPSSKTLGLLNEK